ncbi:hypothetical protein FA15DRAFT_605011, partial [Coprinopsis marcescibilis]
MSDQPGLGIPSVAVDWTTASSRDSIFADKALLKAIITKLKDRDQLLKLSLVSHTFKGPALDCLWEKLDSYVPLFKLVSDLLEIGSVLYLNGRSYSTFQTYAHRIRELRIIDPEPLQPRFSCQVLTHLCKDLGSAPLLPGLRHLSVSHIDEFTATLFALLLSPTLVSVAFSGRSLAQPHLPLLITSLRSHNEHLKNLSLGSEEPQFQLESQFCALIPSFKRLESLKIILPSTKFDTTFFSRIHRNLEDLRDLALDIGFDHPPGPTVRGPSRRRINPNVCPDAPFTPDSFSSLRAFHLILHVSSALHFDIPSSSMTLCTTYPDSFMNNLTTL